MPTPVASPEPPVEPAQPQTTTALIGAQASTDLCDIVCLDVDDPGPLVDEASRAPQDALTAGLDCLNGGLCDTAFHLAQEAADCSSPAESFDEE